MKQMQNLKLPYKDRPSGLFLYCNGCKKYYSSDKDAKCKCGKLVYKARIHIAGTKHGAIPKVIQAQDFIEASRLFQEFKEELISNSYQKVAIKKYENTPTRLIECFAYYMGFLNNVGVPKHKHKFRDSKYISHVDYLFGQYIEALVSNGINCKILNFIEVNDELIGFVHEYFLNTLDYKNKTYNNSMGTLSAFTSHIIDRFGFDYKNPFLGVPDMIVTPKVTSIRENEFIELLKIVTPENGIKMEKVSTLKNLKKKTLYKPWLKFAYRFGLYTGGRSEDIVEPKWTDIILTEKGELDRIKTIDHKIDSANNNRTSEDERVFKYFVITKELKELLIEMEYEKYKGTDKYIIAPEETVKRSHIAVLISKSFSHYYAQLKTGKIVSFRNLRKTFMTGALIDFGVASTALTNHKNISMTDKHYYDKEVTRDDAKETFSVFKRKK